MSHIFSSIVFHFFFDIDEGILESIMIVNYRLFSYKRGPSWKEVQGNTYWSSEDGWVIHTNINKFQWLIDTCVMYIVQCTSLFCSGFCCASKGHKMKFKLKKVVIFITFQSQSCFYSWLFSNTGATKNTVFPLVFTIHSFNTCFNVSVFTRNCILVRNICFAFWSHFYLLQIFSFITLRQQRYRYFETIFSISIYVSKKHLLHFMWFAIVKSTILRTTCQNKYVRFSFNLMQDREEEELGKCLMYKAKDLCHAKWHITFYVIHFPCSTE